MKITIPIVFQIILINYTFEKALGFATVGHRISSLQRYEKTSDWHYSSITTSCRQSTAQSSTDDDDVTIDDTPSTSNDDGTDNERETLKKALIALGASYDRGFGATPSSRTSATNIIEQLTALNPTPNASRGIDGATATTDPSHPPPPLKGAWRMIWCTAQDVLLLAASPVTTVGAIYQVIDPPVATNIIDLIPRVQALLPPGVAPSLLRAEVTTRAESRGSELPLRVGLTFEKVKLQPVEVLGQAVGDVLPPIGWSLPDVSGVVKNLPGVEEGSSPGYFDVLYLDDELLVIKQNEPGGIFALTKVDNYDP